MPETPERLAQMLGAVGSTPEETVGFFERQIKALAQTEAAMKARGEDYKNALRILKQTWKDDATR